MIYQFQNLFIIVLSFFIALEVNALAGWSEAVASSEFVKIETQFGHCTGTRISDHGHILTARHCFNACLIQSGQLEDEPIYPEEGWRSPKLYHVLEERPVYCDMSLEGKNVRAEVVATSRAFMVPSEQSSLSFLSPEMYQEFLEKSYFQSGDFAILKLQAESSARCLRISSLASSLGDAVHYYGYPGASRGGRPEGRESLGDRILMGQGLITPSILDNPCVVGDEIKLRDRYDREELILSSVDILPGASGASLLNSSGEIIGLLNSSYSNGLEMYERYCPGSAVAISIESLVLDLRTRFSREDVTQFFNCSQGN